MSVRPISLRLDEVTVEVARELAGRPELRKENPTVRLTTHGVLRWAVELGIGELQRKVLKGRG